MEDVLAVRRRFVTGLAFDDASKSELEFSSSTPVEVSDMARFLEAILISLEDFMLRYQVQMWEWRVGWIKGRQMISRKKSAKNTGKDMSDTYLWGRCLCCRKTPGNSKALASRSGLSKVTMKLK